MSRPASAASRAGCWRSVVLCVPHVNNNPINYNDPTGHCSELPAEWEGASIACVAGFIPVVQSPSAKEYADLSVDLQTQVELYNAYAAMADVIALGMSSAGAVTEIGLAAIDSISPLGDLAGVGLYYRFINPIEDTASLISFIATFTADVGEGANYIQQYPLEVGIGQDTLVSGFGILLGNVLPLEGVLDTIVNIPIAWYSVNGAAGNIITFIEFRWSEELGWHFITYPAPSTTQGNDDD